MTYIISKLLGDLVRPSVLLLLVAWAGLGLVWCRRSAWGYRLLVAAQACYAIILFLPIDSLVLSPLEDRFPRPAEPAHVDGIIVLSGAIEPRLSRDRGIVSLNSAAERITETVALARRHPEAQVVFTGANSDIIRGGPTEAEWAEPLLQALSVDPARLKIEKESRSTYENALNTWRMISPKPEERWLLVTSASHMPRAIGVFRRSGWNVAAWPVAYRSGHSLSTWIHSTVGERLNSLDIAAHEWVGLLAYWMMGRMDALFPAPAPQSHWDCPAFVDTLKL